MARAKNLERLEKEDKYGLTKRGVNHRKALGLDGDTFAKAKQDKEVETAKLRKLQRLKAEQDLQISRGLLVTKKDIESEGVRIAALFSAQLNNFRNNSAGRLTGLDEIGVRKVLDVEIDNLLEELVNQLKNI